MKLRSLLFVPGDRGELLAKIPRWRPDAVVLDLEDAVAPGAKETARAAVAGADLAVPETAVLVRVNAAGTAWHDDDVAAVAGTEAAGVVLPKAEDPDTVARLRERLAARPGLAVILGIESALGVARARELLTEEGVAGAYFGAEDYLLDVGGRHTAAGLEVLYARSEVVLAGRLGGVPVVDRAVVALDDDAAFTADAEAGRELGYAGKVCIHPRQVVLAHAVFTPSEAEVAAARRVIAAAETGVGVVDGRMVDAVHLAMARQTLERRHQGRQ